MTDTAELIARLISWLTKRGQPNSGMLFRATDPFRNDDAVVEIWGPDAEFIAKHFHGQGASEVADALSSLVRERDEARKVLRDHHKWHAESGVLGIPDGDGGWIEMDNGAEYANSRLCQRTEEALRDMPAEFVVPPRGGWAMGSNHWENWQLAYRQKRAAEARATAAEANAARMREALEALADALKNTTFPEFHPIWNAAKLARNALGGKDE